MNVLVTGGAGFLGSEIIKKLLFRKFNVFNLDLIDRDSLEKLFEKF